MGQEPPLSTEPRHPGGAGLPPPGKESVLLSFSDQPPATRPKHGAATVKTDKWWAWEASEGLASAGGETNPSPLGPPQTLEVALAARLAKNAS